ncbi:DUF748 domain-containing protein [Ekhidna sp.]
MKKVFKITLSIFIFLILVRISLPYFLTRYVNQVLNDLPGYSGSIKDVDLQLYKGAYAIDSLQIFKSDSSVHVPLFSSHRIELSLQWNALLDGAIVGEVDLIKSTLTMVGAENTNETQYGEDVDWTVPLKKLIPLQINKLAVSDSRIFFKNFQSEPQINLYMQSVNIEATNLSNTDSEEKLLPSKIKGSAVSIGNGRLSLSGDLNVLKQTPDMDIELKFEDVQLKDLNDFLKAYAKIDAEEGTFNLYSEIVVNDGQLEGYVKPIVRDIKLVDFQKDKEQPLELIWESFAGLIIEIFENQKKNQFATKVPLTGSVENPNSKVIPTVLNIFSNAFIEAFKKNTDGTIDFGSKEKAKEEV